MSGECEGCGEHCVDCQCNNSSEEYRSPPPKRKYIINPSKSDLSSENVKPEPWNDKEFMEWAFKGEPISLGIDGFHKVLDKLYETYLHIKDGSIRQRYLMEMIEINREKIKSIKNKFNVKNEK